MQQTDLMAFMQISAQSSIQDCLDDESYQEEKITDWETSITKELLKKMKSKYDGKYKFVASCMILSRNTQYINETTMAIWDKNKDVKITTKWSNETMQCILSLWGFRTRFG